jgi:hypothetical protein
MRPTPVLVIAGLLAATGGVAVAEKRVHPSAHPSRPTQSEDVLIRFRARETLDGVYHAEARRRPREPGCQARRSHVVTAPKKGRVVRLTLRPPSVDGQPNAHRWCIGTYRARVFFKQTVRCNPPVQCGDSVEIPLGRTTFTVIAEP